MGRRSDPQKEDDMTTYSPLTIYDFGNGYQATIESIGEDEWLVIMNTPTGIRETTHKSVPEAMKEVLSYFIIEED